MEVSISKEAFVFLCSSLTGGLIVFVYDLFQVIRRMSTVDFFMTHIEDGLFWIITFCIVFFSVLYINNGILRMYELLGAVLGGVLYKMTLSGLITVILQRFLTFFSKFFQLFLKILLTPIRFVYNIIYGCLYLLFKPLTLWLQKGYRRFLESVKRTRRFVKKK